MVFCNIDCLKFLFKVVLEEVFVIFFFFFLVIESLLFSFRWEVVVDNLVNFFFNFEMLFGCFLVVRKRFVLFLLRLEFFLIILFERGDLGFSEIFVFLVFVVVDVLDIFLVDWYFVVVFRFLVKLELDVCELRFKVRDFDLFRGDRIRKLLDRFFFDCGWGNNMVTLYEGLYRFLCLIMFDDFSLYMSFSVFVILEFLIFWIFFLFGFCFIVIFLLLVLLLSLLGFVVFFW